MYVDTTRTRLLDIGRTQTTIAQLISVLQDSGAMPDTIVVAAPAPAGAAIGERLSLQQPNRGGREVCRPQ
jgi:hypothetical protein